MKKWQRWLVVLATLILAITSFYLNPVHRESSLALKSHHSDITLEPAVKLPLMLELGSTSCVPCQMMEKVLENLHSVYSEQFQVEFKDVTIKPEIGREHRIKLIPTQIFFAADGQEIFRHEGFFPEIEIINQWQRLGYDFTKDIKAATTTSTNSGLLSKLFNTLGQAVTGTPAIALFAAFIWGILSIILSPCHLASIPLIVGFIDKQGRMSVRRASLIATLFAVGILLTIAIIGALTGAAGRMMGDLGPYANYGVAVIFLIVALQLADVISLEWSAPSTLKIKQKGLMAAFLLGLIFGIALGPCTFAYMAPMLAITFKIAATQTTYAIALLLAYGIGHCSVIILAGTFTEVLQNYLNWNEKSKSAIILKKACALLVMVGGLYLIYKT